MSVSDGFAGVFGAVPETTILILVERGGVAKNGSLYKAAARYGKMEEYIPPKGVALERWIANRGAEVGVKIDRNAQASIALQASEARSDGERGRAFSACTIEGQKTPAWTVSPRRVAVDALPCRRRT